MSRLRSRVLLTALSLLLAQPAASADTAVGDFGLIDHRGAYQRLYYHRDARAVVLFVQGNGCPIARNALPAVHELRDRYAGRGVVFWALNANPQDDRESVAAEAREFGIDIPVLVDETQLVAEALGVTRTAEAIVIDPEGWRIVYRGPVDDRLSYETQKPATRHYVAEALEAILGDDGGRVDKPTRDPHGCLILFPDRAEAGGEAIRYADDVAPILERGCVSCHRRGGVAPWAMTEHAMVRGWSAMIRETLLTGRMPPWQADPEFGHFSNSLALTREETRTLVHWIDAGAQRAEGEADPLAESRPPSAPEWSLGEPDLVIDVPEQKLPATGVLPYRYEIVDVPLERDVWIRAVEVRPSNVQAMHHGTAYVLRPDGTRGGRSEGPSFVQGLFAGYVPGRAVERFPTDTAIHLPAGSRIRFELHYTTTGRPEVDRPRLGLYLSEEPARHELRIGAAVNTRFHIPARKRWHEDHASRTIERDILVYRLNPHMHFRGRAARFEARYPDGTRETLLNVPAYNFNWQHQYVLAEPKLIPAGTRIRLDVAFDNSKHNPANPDPNRSVEWGLQSFDEMLIGYFTYREVEPGDALLEVARAGADR